MHRVLIRQRTGPLPESVPCNCPGCGHLISPKDLAGFADFDKDAVESDVTKILVGFLWCIIHHFLSNRRHAFVSFDRTGSRTISGLV